MSPSEDVLCAIASNPNTPISVLAKMENYDGRRIFQGFIINPTVSLLLQRASDATDPEELRELASNPIKRVRSRVVNNRNVPYEDLDRLSKEFPHARNVLEERAKETPLADLLGKMAQSTWVAVRIAVAGNSHTPENLLSILSADKEALVVTAIVQNSRTPEKNILSLTDNHEMLDQKGSNLWEALARNVRLPAEKSAKLICKYLPMSTKEISYQPAEAEHYEKRHSEVETPGRYESNGYPEIIGVDEDVLIEAKPEVPYQPAEYASDLQ